MLPMMLRSIAESRRSILYRPEFNGVTGSVTASILLQQVIFWADVSRGEPFYKFISPCKHEKYREGDSWSEELGFSKKEFAGAIAKIGTKVTKGESKSDAFNGQNPENLIVYWTDADRVTWWQLNIGLAEKLISGIYLGKLQKGIYPESDKREFTYSYPENTTKNTHKEASGILDTPVASRISEPKSLLSRVKTNDAIAKELIQSFTDWDRFFESRKAYLANTEYYRNSSIKIVEGTILKPYRERLEKLIKPWSSPEDKELAIAEVTELIKTHVAELGLDQPTPKNSQQGGLTAQFEQWAVVYKKDPAEARKLAGYQWNKFLKYLEQNECNT